MTYDPGIAFQILHGLACGVGSVIAGLALGGVIILILPKWDNG
jgi:hypothetical protein